MASLHEEEETLDEREVYVIKEDSSQEYLHIQDDRKIT
jgi:hypothetical protein